jgi:NTP pyrophosphatase (non-canonical NTP hydrolase)
MSEKRRIGDALASAALAAEADADGTGSRLEKPPAASPTETETTISEWAQATFGHVGSNASVAARALKELAELIQKLTANDAHPDAAEELADVEIVLARLWVRLCADRQREIDRKMATNRARKWRLTGDGHGQHV